jgi:hypothetical protein
MLSTWFYCTIFVCVDATDITTTTIIITTTIPITIKISRPGAPLTDDVDVAVCTFEKANVLINQLLDEGREERLSMVVVDELHLVSDTHRGFLLEVLLSKVIVIIVVNMGYGDNNCCVLVILVVLVMGFSLREFGSLCVGYLLCMYNVGQYTCPSYYPNTG